MILSIMILSIMILSIMILSIMILSIMTLSITIHCILTLSTAKHEKKKYEIQHDVILSVVYAEPGSSI
jgi:hypothetical protein